MQLNKEEQPSHIPFMDLGALHQPIQKEIEKEIASIARNSSFVQGPSVHRFEEEYASYCTTDYAVGCNSGTSAIHMALRACDVGPGDEVITVSHTFVGTVWGILYCGATPVFADISENTMNMDVSKIEGLITENTKAIIPVHLYGQPVDMDPLLKIAGDHDLVVIEDAAQAHGARYKGQRVGSLGDMACFSFYPGKNLGAWGEAGAVTTSNKRLADRLRSIRDHGQSEKYHHEELGYNYRMDSIQAAVLTVKLRNLDEWNVQRKEIVLRYKKKLSNVCSIKLPQQAEYAESANHLFVIRHNQRDNVRECLGKQKIDTGLHYPLPVHRQTALIENDEESSQLPITDRVANTCLSLPLFPGMSTGQIDTVCGVLQRNLR